MRYFTDSPFERMMMEVPKPERPGESSSCMFISKPSRSKGASDGLCSDQNGEKQESETAEAEKIRL